MLHPCRVLGDFCTNDRRYNDNEYIKNQFIALKIVDKDANGVVGGIHASFKEERENGLYSDKLPENGLLEYEGVFGATKQ